MQCLFVVLNFILQTAYISISARTFSSILPEEQRYSVGTHRQSIECTSLPNVFAQDTTHSMFLLIFQYPAPRNPHRGY